MRRILGFLLAGTVLLVNPARVKAQDACAEFDALAAKTFAHDPTEGVSPEEAQADVANMNAFWATVIARKKEFTPCLRKLVANKDTKMWIRHYCCNLLMNVSPGADSVKLMIDVYTTMPLTEDTPHNWLVTLTEFASVGYNISPAAERWLKEPDVDYYLTDKNFYQVDRARGALSLFGSMHENTATPVLAKIAKDVNHPARWIAFGILCDEWTPASRQALKEFDPTTVPEAYQARFKTALGDTPLLQPRTPPRIPLKDWQPAMDAVLQSQPAAFIELTKRQPDWERDLAGALTAEDLSFLRRVRRKFIRQDDKDAAEFHGKLTQVVATMFLAEESKRRAPVSLPARKP